MFDFNNSIYSEQQFIDIIHKFYDQAISRSSLNAPVYPFVTKDLSIDTSIGWLITTTDDSIKLDLFKSKLSQSAILKNNKVILDNPTQFLKLANLLYHF